MLTKKTLFNQQICSDLILKFANELNCEEIESFYCHKSILINNSEYFWKTFIDFKDLDKDIIEIKTQSIELDKIILEFLYTNVLIDLNERDFSFKIELLIRSGFYGILKLQIDIVKNILLTIKPFEISVLVDNFLIIPEIKTSVIKYVRTFFVDIEDISDVLDKLYEIDKDIPKEILRDLVKKPIIGSSREKVHSFVKEFNIGVRSIPTLASLDDILIREVTPNEIDRFKHLPKIDKYVAFNMHHYIIFHFMNKYGFFDCVEKICFNNITKEKRKLISEQCKDPLTLRKIIATLV